MQDEEIEKLRQINRDELFERCKKLNLPVFENDDLELLQILYYATIENQTDFSQQFPEKSSN